MKPSILPLYQTGVNRENSPIKELIISATTGGRGGGSSDSSRRLFQCLSIPFRKLYYYRKSTILFLLTLVLLSVVYLDYISFRFGSRESSAEAENGKKSAGKAIRLQDSAGHMGPLPGGGLKDPSKIEINHLAAIASVTLHGDNDYDQNQDKPPSLLLTKPKREEKDTSGTRQCAETGKGNCLTAKRRTHIIGMMQHAWAGYQKYAWGANELRPVSKSSHSSGIFGSTSLGASIIDAIDTLYIMGLKEEYTAARDWIEKKFSIKSAQRQLSVFETNIRFLGGLLSAFALTKDDMFREKAREVADVLLPAFNTPTGIPHGLVSPSSLASSRKAASNWGWAAGGSSILSEFGSLHLEFHYLADITGEKIYFDKKMWDDAIGAIEKNMLVKSEKGLWYFAEMLGSQLDYKFSHLACFIGGSYAMASWDEGLTEERRNETEHIAAEIAHTCHESYISTETGIGPEAFRFDNDGAPVANNAGERYYILRPEVVETWFYLYRTTHNPKYRDWAWKAAMAIDRYCKSEAGYSGIRDVNSKQPQQDDVQQSFFLAETLKNFEQASPGHPHRPGCPHPPGYQTAHDSASPRRLPQAPPDDEIPLDKWVFNTEAHPLPVRDSQMLKITNGIPPQ